MSNLSAIRWYRGGPRKAPPEWFTSSKTVASFYGDVSEMAVSGDLLDLRSVGIDVPEDQEGLPFRVTTLTSGEMYEWAEKSWRYLRNDGFDGVIVKQWHAELSAKPYAALLLWGASDG